MSENSFAGANYGDTNKNDIFTLHDQKRCKRYHLLDNTGYVDDVEIIPSDKYSFKVTGNVTTNTNSKLFIKYSAANPPTYNSSFSGSALPFPSEEIAFENTPNKGTVEVVDKKFTFKLRYPNSYYKNLGNIYVHPYVKIVVINDKNDIISDEVVLNVGEGIPFRTLTWSNNRNWNDGPLFYTNPNLPIRTQNQILLDSAYPKKNNTPNNFWGIMPPH